ncbi:MAG: acetolactate synthase small subunit [Acidimicrobiales bacterium]
MVPTGTTETNVSGATTPQEAERNKPGVLASRRAFARRGFNIHSLAVAPTEDDRVSRITIVADTASVPVEQIVKQLYKLIHVVKINELAGRLRRAGAAHGHGEGRGRVHADLELTQIFGGKVLNTGATEMMYPLRRLPEEARRLRGTAPALRHLGHPAHWPGGVASSRPGAGSTLRVG